MRILLIILIECFIFLEVGAQPEPCEINAMTSTCADACVVCDIDGFTGTNDLSIQGQTFPEFCTTIFHNMSYIAFIAGTENLTLTVSVTNCTIDRGVEIGIFESLDCQNFTAVTDCNTDVGPNSTATFSNNTPLVVGQHYYLILDGSMGDICDWTFNVIEGSTVVGDLTTSGVIEGPKELCSNLTSTYSTIGESGATLFYWTVDGVPHNDVNSEIDISFPEDGEYELCVTAANVCDKAPPTCTIINVISPTPTYLEETICANECFDVAGETVCLSGLSEYVITLPDGCDSLIYLDLIILPEISSSLEINLCTGNEFTVGTSIFSSTGIFEETVQTEDGCDSIVMLDLTIIECEIIGTIEYESPICHGDNNGSINFTLENGTAPFTYEWNNISTTTIQGSGTTNLFSDILIENIPAGIYEINVRDDFGNNIVFIQTIPDPPLLYLDTDKIDYNGYNISCYNADDGAINVMANGGISPYTYSWDTGATDNEIKDLSAGDYYVEVTDGFGCIVREDIVLIEPDELNLMVNFIDPNCDGFETGIIALDTLSGGTAPYTYTLGDDAYSSTDTYIDLGPGSYIFSVLDANGCTADTTSDLYEVDIPILYMEEDQEVDLGCSIIISASTNNTSLEAISWTNFENSLECDDCLSTAAAPVNNTKYILSVTSMDDCTASDSMFVTVNKIRDVFSPNAFSPNSDGVNDYFMLTPGKSVSLIKKFNVYDRWGSLVHAESDLDPNADLLGWDGYFKGKLLNTGVYAWIAEVEYLDGEVQFMSGDVTLFL